MKIFIVAVLLALYPSIAQAVDVSLAWDANLETDLAYYTLYQADKFEDKTGPWTVLATIGKDATTITVSVEAGKNFAWYLTASDESGNESQASNTVSLYDKMAPAIPSDFRKTPQE